MNTDNLRPYDEALDGLVTLGIPIPKGCCMCGSEIITTILKLWRLKPDGEPITDQGKIPTIFVCDDCAKDFDCGEETPLECTVLFWKQKLPTATLPAEDWIGEPDGTDNQKKEEEA